MPNLRNKAKFLTFNDFQPSQPEPVLPKRHLEGDTWVCAGCGSELRFENDWCGPCSTAWASAHSAWIELNNSEFDEWYAIHQSEIDEPNYSDPNAHNAGFLSDSVIEGRKRYFKDTIQPWRDGTPSQEYIEAYPEQAKKMFTEKERRTAKPVWRDIAPAAHKIPR